MNLLPSLLFILVLIGLVLGASQPLTWSGTWTSTCESNLTNSRNCYGGYLTLCTSGTNIFGTYSGLGFINGTTNGRIATGTWIEGGYTDNAQGGFFWQLNSNQNEVKFTGYYWLNSDPCTNYTWNGRLFDPYSEPALCVNVLSSSTTPSIAGHWQAGVLNAGQDDLYICLGENNQFFSASSTITPQNYETYSYGRAFHNAGQLAQGSGFYKFGTQFYNTILLMVLTDTNTLVTFVYDVDSVFQAGNSYNTATHQQITWTRAGVASSSQCNMFQNLAQISWQGAWTDSRNGAGRLYTCVVSSNGATLVSGVYSQYGYINGTVNGLTLSGNFYESGSNGRTGTFSITMSSDGNTFTGYSVYSNDPSNQIKWSENRVDVTDSSASNCWLESTSTTTNASGSWIVDYYGNYLDLCINGTSVVGSYEYGTSFTPGYIEGTTIDGNSLQVTFYEEHLTSIGIIRYTVNGLQTSIWNEPVASPYYEPCNGYQVNSQYDHQAGVLARSPFVASNCDRNAYIATGVFPPVSSADLVIPTIFAFMFCLILL